MTIEYSDENILYEKGLLFSFSVILNREHKCWKYQSVALFSIKYGITTGKADYDLGNRFCRREDTGRF